MARLIFPCELVVWKILPAIKAEIARELKRSGLKQKEIAKLLGVTEAAISQYFSKKRAKDFKVPREFKEMLSTVARHVKESEAKSVLMFGVCQVCKEVRRSGAACKLCRSVSRASKECELCFD